MDTVIRPLEVTDRPAVARLLDDAVGAGFWSFGRAGDDVELVAAAETRVIGVALCRIEATADEAVPALAAGSPSADGPVLHVRAVAVATEARRRGVARRLLERAETEAVLRGARAAYLFAWLPADRPEPAAVPFYVSAGYVPGRDIADFYAGGSLAGDAECPYCGAPPCRCAARPFTKTIGVG